MFVSAINQKKGVQFYTETLNGNPTQDNHRNEGVGVIAQKAILLSIVHLKHQSHAVGGA